MTDTRVLIVEARFYEAIADELAAGALEVFDADGVTYDRLSVPGAFELPAAIEFAIRSAATGQPGAVSYDGFLALGCVIRGETSHYDYVCGESARGIQDIALRHGAAVAFGVLTVENGDQAWARARRDKKNKGAEVAKAVLRMIELKRQFRLG